MNLPTQQDIDKIYGQICAELGNLHFKKRNLEIDSKKALNEIAEVEEQMEKLERKKYQIEGRLALAKELTEQMEAKKSQALKKAAKANAKKPEKSEDDGESK